MILDAIPESMAIFDPLMLSILFPFVSETVEIVVPMVNPRSERNFFTSGVPEILTTTPVSPTLAMDTGIDLLAHARQADDP